MVSASDPAQVANGFEALFLSLMLKPLDSSTAFFGSGSEGRTFASLFRQQLADQLATARPLGIADRIEATLRSRVESPTLKQARGLAGYGKAKG